MARNLSTLVVDPNLDSRLDVSKTLTAAGLEILGEASYGTEATFLAAEIRPSVILLALEDPPARALATLEALQQQMPDTPVLTYSTSADAQLMRQAMRAGARDLLSKPLREAELREAIHTVLSQEEQRQVARWSEQSSASARGTVFTIAGAKGGIGKTAIATNLAIAIRALTRQEVALVDGDAQFGDVAVMMDMDVERSLADLARDEPDIDREVIRRYLRRHESGVNMLMAASEPNDWRAVQPEHISAMAQVLAETHEYVIIDTPGAMNEAVAASLNEAAIVFLVTSLDVSSVKDTKTALRILQSWAMPPSRVRLIINDNTRASAVSVADVERACDIKASLTIKYDSRVGVSVQTGKPLVLSEPRSRFARSVMELAEQVTGIAGHPASSKGMKSLQRLTVLGRRA
ncbi:MAG: response regulator [Dehalococcoidia bacterium]|nr:MAG: response regulator [Dehalococcoidia bacterium]